MIKKLVFVLLWGVCSFMMYAQQNLTNDNFTIEINRKTEEIEISYKGISYLKLNTLLNGESNFGKAKVRKRSFEGETKFGERKVVLDYLDYSFSNKDGVGFQILLFDEAVAIRQHFGAFDTIYSEVFEISFEEQPSFIAQQLLPEKNFSAGYEAPYEFLSENDTIDGLLVTPLIFEISQQKIQFFETDLLDYPALFWEVDGLSASSVFPAYPKKIKTRNTQFYVQDVVEREDFLALNTKGQSTPWRVFKFVNEDTDLIHSDILYALNTKAEDINFDWVKPGKVAWDWYSANRLFDVDFEAGINTATYKYYVDFAAEYGIEYINIDEGWSDNGDLFDLNEEVDVPSVVSYAKEKGVGVFLWATSNTVNNQMDEAFKKFEEWGVSGVKVDFFLRDDQQMLQLYERMAIKAAEHKLLLNFHGCSKPTGLQIKYPNVMNYEAVRGLEYNKFEGSPGATPDQLAMIPFIRSAAGPMDYTPGAMLHYNKEDWQPNFFRPPALGTRCLQLASYVVLDQPLVMLAESPSHYEKEPEIVKAIVDIPTVWDEIVPLDAKVGSYAVVAKRKGDKWYVGGVTNWEARTLTLDLSKLGEGQKNINIFSDGINAESMPHDYDFQAKAIDMSQPFTVKMASGGGFLMVVE